MPRCARRTQLNKWLQLEPFPDNSFRNAMMLVLVLDIVAAFLWDRLMLLIFAPKILWASVEGTTWQDVVNALKVVAICYTVIYFLATVSLFRDEKILRGGEKYIASMLCRDFRVDGCCATQRHDV